MKKIIKVLGSVYILILIMFLFLPIGGRTSLDAYGIKVFSLDHLRFVNYIPLYSLVSYYRKLVLGTIEPKIVIANILVNVFMFVPLALYFIYKFHFKMWSVKTLVLLMVCSFLVESIQFLSLMGAVDIDDVILNSLGGYVISNLICIIHEYIYRYRMR